MNLRNAHQCCGWVVVGLLVCTYAAIASAKSPTAPTKVDFNRDIRPIFSEHCYACHGPDEKKRKAGLRLDLQENAFAELKSGNRPLVAGDLPLGDPLTTTNPFLTVTNNLGDSPPALLSARGLSAAGSSPTGTLPTFVHTGWP